MQTFYRDRLKTTQARCFYDQMVRSIRTGCLTGQFRFSCSDPAHASRDGFDAVTALRLDRPDFFFLGHQSSVRICGRNMDLENKVCYTPEEIVRCSLQMDRTLNRLTEGLKGLSQWERERIVYARIARMLTYQNHGTPDKPCPHDHSAVGPAINGTGVCEGFACLVTLAMRRAGIPCIRVNGFGSTGPHAWNMVWINGRPCQLDITNETVRQNEPGYFYFNLTDAEMGRNHYLTEQNMPRCTDSSLGYHHRRSLEFPSIASASGFFDRFFHSGGKICSVRFGSGGSLSEKINSALESCPNLAFRFSTCPNTGSALVWVNQNAS